MSSPTTTTLSSPFDESDDPQGDYAEQMRRVLSSSNGGTSDAADGSDDEDFGEFVYSGHDAEEFVYSGKDAVDLKDEPEEGYRDQLDGILGSSNGDDTSAPEPDSAGDKALGGPGEWKDIKSMNGGFKTGAFAHPAPSPPSDLASPRSSRFSQDGFPTGQLTPSNSIPDSLASAAFPRRPVGHPQIARLRSAQLQHPRIPSASTQLSAFECQTVEDRPASSTFDLRSRRSSLSNLPDTLTFDSPDASTPPPSSSVGRTPSETFKWTPLRRISTRIYPPSTKGGAGFTSAGAAHAGLMGTPTVLAVNGIVAMGTSKGWVLVFDFSQNLRCVCGTEAIAKEAGEVTAVAISQDHTFIAVGHALGSIHLYALTKPSQPARSVPPTTLPLVLTGRKEGHLAGSKIMHLGFVGERHTAIVSSDDTGLAFYHSLGKVLMLASTDIIRMLGRYPDLNSVPPTPRSSNPSLPASPAINGQTKSKKPTTILDMAPLPLGPSPHSSDSHSLVALLTPAKLVIVGLKPTPRTWWRASAPSSQKEGDREEYSRTGVLAWFPSTAKLEQLKANGDLKNGEVVEQGEDPVLAFAWDNQVRLVKIAREASGEPGKEKASGISFVELEGWSTDHAVLGLQWYNQQILFVLTPHHVEVYDIRSRGRIGRDGIQIQNVVSHDHYASAFVPHRPGDTLAYSSSFRSYKQKLFLLTISDLRAGAVLSWADRILALMQPGTIPEAIELTTSYVLGRVDASTIGLPVEPAARREVVEPKLREILGASLDFVFSEDRLRDGSHSDGATMQRLFENLVGTCVRACLAIDDVDWLFDDLYERYEQNGIEAIFLERIEPFVLSGSVHALPPSVSQRLIAIHEERQQYDAAQRIIWHVDPEFLDLNQALGLCQRQKLYDALIYVYMRSMHDFVGPVVELLALVREIQRHRKHRPRWVGDGADTPSVAATKGEQAAEAMVPDAYKIYAYLSHALAGLSYPNKEPLVYEEGIAARTAIYSFLFSGRTITWPERGGRPILTSDDDREFEPPYPYLRLLLRFDAEAMLDALDLAFEEAYLEDDIPGRPVDRQRIVDLLLEVMAPGSPDFSAIDHTFLRIFLARNLPKYPQFIRLPPTTLHSILVGLASDADQSTIEDRQLAAEFLLSTYTPPDGDEIVRLFEEAGFFRILRSIYRGERRWAALASTYLRDPDVGGDIFQFLRETLKLAGQSSDLQRQDLVDTILDAVPTLVQAHESGLQETADLIDAFLPDKHAVVIERLKSSQWRQFAYLRCLLEPGSVESHTARDRAPSTRLDTSQRLLYLSLLCTHEPYHVVRFFETESQKLAALPEALRICEETEVYDALIWAIDQGGDTGKALDKIDDTLNSRTELMLQALLAEAEEEEEKSEPEEEEQDNERPDVQTDAVADRTLEQIAAITRVGIQICVTRTSGPQQSKSISGEELWFRLLSSLVATVRAVRAIAPAPVRPSDMSSSHRRISGASIIIHGDEPRPLSARSSDILSGLIPTALSSLVSTTTSREVSFPNLMRRLIDSNARSPAADRSYAEFKAIVTSMLDTYVFEGDLLDITSKISAQDLFEHVEHLRIERDKGWRAQGELCGECLQPVWGPAGQMSPPMSRSASASRVVETLGMGGRPRMKKRPSLKGKEVEWTDGAPVEREPAMQPPSGIVVGRDGSLFHHTCHLTRTSQGGMKMYNTQ
ncbi:late endosome to vacuole transport-related protein [Pseudohyphozyma bogoriensis]|nr:late endosome to vacuole transport-related protein [Pseudohyphozyma bogoriensis]